MTTKGASFGYEEVIDLHTESDRVTVIGIHTPTTDTPRRMAPGLFAQFKKFKYLGCSVTMIPAATLPVDPSQVSYEGGEPPIDPRDMLNPILFHGCHGNDLGNILNRIYSAGAVEGSDLSQLLHSDSASFWSMLNKADDGDTLFPLTILESLYYRALTDRTWQKANIQRGFRKTGLHPRIYSLATNMQLQNAEYLMSNEFPAPAPFSGEKSSDPYLGEMWDVENTTANPVRFFTPRTQRLGWLDTRQVVPYTATDPYADATPFPQVEIKKMVEVSTVDTKLPRIYMGVILLPPAYKQEQYFRMIVTHRFAFAGFRGISMSNLELENPNYFNLNGKITDGDSSDPDDPGTDPPTPPEPEPDPEPDPEPESDYPASILTNKSGAGYTRVNYNTAEDVTSMYLTRTNASASIRYVSSDDVEFPNQTSKIAASTGGTYPAIFIAEDNRFVKQNSAQNRELLLYVENVTQALTGMGAVIHGVTTLDDLKAIFNPPKVYKEDS